jgi:hypothetical protein
MTDNQRERYIAKLKEFYYKDIDKIKRYVNITDYEYLNHPSKTYNIEDIPNWYPDILKLYLTEISDIMVKSAYPCKIHIFDKNKSLNDIHCKAVEGYYKDIGRTREEQLEYFEYELELRDNNKTLEELIEIGKHVEIINSTMITVGNLGCTFSYDYCLVTDRVMYTCYDDKVDSGIVNEYNYLVNGISRGESLEEYLFRK